VTYDALVVTSGAIGSLSEGRCRWPRACLGVLN